MENSLTVSTFRVVEYNTDEYTQLIARYAKGDHKFTLTKNEQVVLAHLGDEYNMAKRDGDMYLTQNGEEIDGGYTTYFLGQNGIVYGYLYASNVEIVVGADGLVSQSGGLKKLRREAVQYHEPE